MRDVASSAPALAGALFGKPEPGGTRAGGVGVFIRVFLLAGSGGRSATSPGGLMWVAGAVVLVRGESPQWPLLPDRRCGGDTAVEGGEMTT